MNQSFISSAADWYLYRRNIIIYYYGKQLKIIIYIWDSAFSKLCGNPGEATCLCQRSTKLAVSPHQRSSKLVPNSPAKVPKAKPHPHSLQTPQKSTLVNFIWFTDHIKYWDQVQFVSRENFEDNKDYLVLSLFT